MARTSSHVPSADAIRRQVADEIVTGQLAPGDRLEELDLAARFGVSRTPVREALRQLAATGLVQMRPRKGVVVTQIDAEGLAQLFEAVGCLEGTIAGLAARRMTATARKRLEQLQRQCVEAMRAGDRTAYVAHNNDFHEWIAVSAGNVPLAEMVMALRLRLQPFRNAAFRAKRSQRTDRMTSSLAEHRVLVAAMLSSDAAAAETAMREHVASSAASVLDFYLGARGASRLRDRGAA